MPLLQISYNHLLQNSLKKSKHSEHVIDRYHWARCAAEEDTEKSKELSRSSARRFRGSSRSHQLDLLLLVRSPRHTPMLISTANQRRIYRYPHVHGRNATRRCASTRARLGFCSGREVTARVSHVMQCLRLSHPSRIYRIHHSGLQGS